MIQRTELTPRTKVDVAANAHFGAGNSREFANWETSSGSADADLLPDLDELRVRSRDLDRNEGIASAGHRTLLDNVVGVGHRLSAKPDWRALGRTKEWADEWAKGVEAIWRSWANSTECDAAGKCTFRTLTRQAFNSIMLNGEALALPLWLPRSDSRWSTRLQLIESDRLSNKDDQQDNERLRGGIEIDEFGRPLAYHIKSEHPGDQYFNFGGFLRQWEWRVIPAATAWGRKRVLHMHEAERAEQRRGKPLLSAIIPDIKMLSHYKRTEVQAAVVNAMIAGIVQTPLPPEAVIEMLGGDVNSQQFQDYFTQMRRYTAALKGGAMLSVPPGSEVQPFIPSRPASNYDPFTKSVMKNIAAALGIPYEVLMKDWTETNYSSARAGFLESARTFGVAQAMLSDTWSTPVYTLWLEEAVNAGLVEAPEFYGNLYAYTRSEWIPPGRGWVDPVKEAQGAQLRMGMNISTLQRECAEQGLDWEDVLEQRAVEKRRMEEMGLTPEEALQPAGQQQEDREEDRIPA